VFVDESEVQAEAADAVFGLVVQLLGRLLT
jgi:hypothetical protein